MTWPVREEKGWGRREIFTAWRLLSLPRLQIRLHRMCEPDKPEFYHSHPRHFVSLLLCGTYFEEIEGKRSRWRRRGSLAWRSRAVYHAAWHPHGRASWSLVFFLGTKQPWYKAHYGDTGYVEAAHAD